MYSIEKNRVRSYIASWAQIIASIMERSSSGQGLTTLPSNLKSNKRIDTGFGLDSDLVAFFLHRIHAH
jgi:hypothetical protein